MNETQHSDPPTTGLYLLLLSVHGLVRGKNMELGRDPDTGGQTTYAVELAKALSEHPRVDRVDLVTRQIISKKVDASYAEPIEELGNNAFIVRIPFGPRRYLRKERLWPYLDVLTDLTVQHIRKVGRVPDVVHGHYADAGYTGAQLARLLGVPFVFTGHSLGRVKQQLLQAKGLSKEGLEKKYNFRHRIEAEEIALDTAALVVASTAQEIEQQYELYDNYAPKGMKVIPPGIDLSRFSPPTKEAPSPPYRKELARFLSHPDRPMILAIARPDERKNLGTLVKAFAEVPELRSIANLVLIAGTRKSLEQIPPRSRRVMRSIMLLIDEYDLYGHIAYPKQHTPSDIPDLYRLAASTQGVFVNPALTEPFGLTLIESAASGLPIIATNDGGPRDIIAACQNGMLIDPLDSKALGEAMLTAVSNKKQWTSWSDSGIRGAHARYSWQGHVEHYLTALDKIFQNKTANFNYIPVSRTRLTSVDRILVTTLDDILTGDPDARELFLKRLHGAGTNVGFCVTTSRTLPSALALLEELSISMPEVLIASGGVEIFYNGRVTDRSWQRHIDYKWRPEKVIGALKSIKELVLRPTDSQHPFRIRYLIAQGHTIGKRKISRHLRQHGVPVNVISSFGSNIDILPIRASTGLAIRYLTLKWGISPGRLLIAGYSGIDEEILSGNTLGVVVSPHSKEIAHLRERPRIYFTKESHARGLLEGIDHYNFFGNIKIPDEEEYDSSIRGVDTRAP